MGAIMDRVKKYLNLRCILLIAVQTLFICTWFYFLNQHELFSKEGYQYSKYNGLYFLCGIIAVVCMWDNLANKILLPRRKKAILCVCSAIYAVAMVLANYPVFERMLTEGNPLGLYCSLVGGFCVSFHILACAVRRLPIHVQRTATRTHAVRFYCLTFASMAAVYLVHFFCVAYPGYFQTDSYTAIIQCITGRYDNTSPYYHTRLVGLCLQLGQLLGGQGILLLLFTACFNALRWQQFFPTQS